MKLLGKVFALLGCLVLVNPAFCQKAPILAKQSPEYETVFYAKCSLGEVQLAIETPTVYLLRGEPALFFRFLTFDLKRNNQQVDVSAGFLDVDGDAVPYSFTSNSETIEIEAKGDVGRAYTFKQPGKFHLIANVGEEAIAVPVEVVQLDFAKMAPAGELIKSLGFPTSKKKIFVGWPDLETHDGIIYNPDAGRPENLEHWRFEKLPNAVFAIKHNVIIELNSNPPTQDTLYRLAWLNPAIGQQIAETRELTKPPAETAMAAEELPFTLWTARSGAEVRARYRGFQRGKVSLELQNGDVREVPLSDFSYADQAKLKKRIREEAKKK